MLLIVIDTNYINLALRPVYNQTEMTIKEQMDFLYSHSLFFTLDSIYNFFRKKRFETI